MNPRPDPSKSSDRIRETVIVSGRTFLLDRPAGSPRTEDDSIPYWSELWPAARMLAKAVLREPWERFPQPVECLEIGCGLGLGGIAALACGLDVTFCDRDETALRFASGNARLNGFDRFRIEKLDFGSPPAGLSVPVIIGSDVLYKPPLIDPVVAFLGAVLSPAGIGLIADPDRASARPFREAAERAGFRVESQFIRAGEPGGERHKGTLYRIAK